MRDVAGGVESDFCEGERPETRRKGKNEVGEEGRKEAGGSSGEGESQEMGRELVPQLAAVEICATQIERRQWRILHTLFI